MAAIINITQDWEHYPNNLPHSFCVAEQDNQRQVFQNENFHLFSGNDDVEVWKYDYSEEGTLKWLMPPRMRLNGSRPD